MARLYLSPPDVGDVERELLLEAFDSNWIAPVGPLLDRWKGGRRLMVAAFAVGRAVLCVFMANHLRSLLFYPAAFGTLALSKRAVKV